MAEKLRCTKCKKKLFEIRIFGEILELRCHKCGSIEGKIKLGALEGA